MPIHRRPLKPATHRNHSRIKKKVVSQARERRKPSCQVRSAPDDLDADRQQAQSERKGNQPPHLDREAEMRHQADQRPAEQEDPGESLQPG